jgi:hypothetical protein
MYDVFGCWMLFSKCYLAAFIAIKSFLMWPNIILELSSGLIPRLSFECPWGFKFICSKACQNISEKYIVLGRG